MKDSLNRRLRTAAPQPLGERLVISEKDKELFAAFHRHGPLTARIAWRLIGGNYNSLQDRFTKMFNGVIRDGEHIRYLVRPKEFLFGDNTQTLIYDLHPKAEAHVSLSPFIRRRDHLAHRFMSSCVTASLEIACKENALTYVSRHELLKDSGTEGNPRLEISRMQAVEPDDLFGIEYPDGKFRAFAVEIDRATEPLVSKTARETITTKLEHYFKVIDRQLFKQWGLKGLLVLFVTTAPERINNIMQIARELDPKLASRILFKAYPLFQYNYGIPKDYLDDILSPWETIRGEFDITMT